MSAFIVDSAEQVGAPFLTKDGKRELKQVALHLRDGEGQAPTVAKWYTAADIELPKPGSTIQGELELTDDGFKFKKSGKVGGGNPAAGGRGKSPEEIAHDRANSALIRTYEYFQIPKEQRPELREFLETAAVIHTASSRLSSGAVVKDPE